MNKSKFEGVLAMADVRINGGRPWDIKINNQRVFRRVARGGVSALGDSYIDGEWDCDALDEMFSRLLKADMPLLFKNHPATIAIYLKEKLFNMQKKSQVFGLIKHHYDIGNDLFERMLDKRMAYSCGYWKKAKNLNEAQEAKLDLICKKIGLKKGMSILDIGCGWGSFVKFAAEKYGARAVGITLSKNQAEYAKKSCKNLDVEIRIQDYREVNEKFHRIVSVGMFEHVGHKNYEVFMKAADRCLKDDGLFLLHCFGGKWETPNRMQPETRWVEKYIFPGMALPSLGQITSASDGLFMVEDVQNFGEYYDPTLISWHKNFEKSWSELKEKYGERFY